MNSARALLIGVMLAASAPAVTQSVSSTDVSATQQTQDDTENTPLTASERARARTWELSETEWRRYRSLMQGIRGSVSPENLSPIEVLGIHARDAAERRQYAEAWARAMRADAERILAFQHAYDAAHERLFPDQALIDVAQLAAFPKSRSALESGDRLLVFTLIDCPSCNAVLGRAIDRLDGIAGLDIYVTGAPPDDAAIRAWAQERGIERDWVHERRVTLNRDGGLLKEIDPDATELPAIFRRRGERIERLAYAAL
ncbi:MAG: TIGR03759 family integrating conjugative element protein [Woeseiaceae bacterium]|nr:TIGR03759 family integrating conjugative element protein [Woeseiaceae bacterium]